MKLLVFLMILYTSSFMLHAQVTIKPTMDWSNGTFSILASRPLEPGMSQGDHPRALKLLNEELEPLVVMKLETLSWDHNGTLGDLIKRDSILQQRIQELASMFVKQWSRISEDRRSIEAMYQLDISDYMTVFLSTDIPQAQAQSPIGWVPIPEDNWTGIVIYVPSNIKLQGTSLEAQPKPAFRARILNKNLEVISDPAINERKKMYYRSLADRDTIDSIVGRRPLQTMARALYGENPSDIILSNEDAKKIMASESGRRVIEQGRIAILLDADVMLK